MGTAQIVFFLIGAMTIVEVVERANTHVIGRLLNENGVWVVAPETDQSGKAHSLSLSDPLRLRKISDRHFAVRGTPTDCVIMGVRHILDVKPDLVLSGVNRGANVADDVTYSGTVAAALEGILLGLPGIAVSQQSTKLELGYMPQKNYEFAVAAKFTAGIVRQLIDSPLPADTLLNVNVPGGDVEGVDVTKLGKRLYRDELKKVEKEVDDGRTHYRIYGYEPGMDDQPDTDIGAIARNRLSVTPLSLDWTHHDEIEGLRDRDFERLLGEASP